MDDQRHDCVCTTGGWVGGMGGGGGGMGSVIYMCVCMSGTSG